MLKLSLKRPSQVFFDFYDNPIVVDKLNDRIVQLYPQENDPRPLNASNKSKSEGRQIAVRRVWRMTRF